MSWTEVSNMLDGQAMESQGCRTPGTFMPRHFAHWCTQVHGAQKMGCHTYAGQPVHKDLMGPGV